MVTAIEQLHDRLQLANPVATTAARFALGQVLQTEAPRSWTRLEKGMFVHLPIEIRAAIQRRTTDQEKAMRRAQNEAGHLRQKLKQAADYKQPEIETTEKETSMATKKEGWQKGEGPYSSSKLNMTRESDLGNSTNPKGKDISKIVDVNNDRSGGFSAKLTPKD
jgi:hypothetical protein